MASFAFVVLLLWIVRFRGVKRERVIIVATFRMTIQLVIAGYILIFLFERPSWILTLIVLVIMLIFAIRNVYHQIKSPLSFSIKAVIAISMVLGTILSILYFTLIVIHLSPWYEPRYFIPISGMIIGNSMTGITIGVSTLFTSLKANRDKILGALMLGAKPKVAIKSYINEAFDAAILPTLNNMIGMGIVFLPGMMTGQIIAGINPLLAIEYQIVILLGILGSVTLTVFLFIILSVNSLFTKEANLNVS
ncbi:iron export ABC transporter permease subunit FetB [Bacillus spongiae]|uniref:Iron export ABC transporter permease subunit FetB n=1 Tax=Bacillus spongiae TaxID=2683610 RepID=A0ABU8H9P1_9BACI